MSKRSWRPRVSIRTWFVLLALACGYSACWAPTKNQGVDDIQAVAMQGGLRRRLASRLTPLGSGWPEDADSETIHALAMESFRKNAFNDQAIAPLVVRTEDDRRRYYFWFFGFVAKLPYERDIPQPESDWVLQPTGPSAEEIARREAVFKRLRATGAWGGSRGASKPVP